MQSAPIVASQLLLVDEVLRAGLNMRRAGQTDGLGALYMYIMIYRDSQTCKNFTRSEYDLVLCGGGRQASAGTFLGKDCHASGYNYCKTLRSSCGDVVHCLTGSKSAVLPCKRFNTPPSRLISDDTTTGAQSWFTAVIGRELVLSTWYDRIMPMCWKQVIIYPENSKIQILNSPSFQWRLRHIWAC